MVTGVQKERVAEYRKPRTQPGGVIIKENGRDAEVLAEDTT